MLPHHLLKSVSLLASLAASALTLLAWTMVWFETTIGGPDTSARSIPVTGEVAAPALAALGVAGLALVAALAIAGPFFRIVLGTLQLAIGASVVWSAAAAIAAPAAAAAPLVTDVTGVTGSDSINALIATITLTAWPFVAVALGVFTVGVGLFILLTARRWPSSARKYQAVRLEETTEPESDVTAWDSLSDGGDPTSR